MKYVLLLFTFSALITGCQTKSSNINDHTNNLKDSLAVFNEDYDGYRNSGRYHVFTNDTSVDIEDQISAIKHIHQNPDIRDSNIEIGLYVHQFHGFKSDQLIIITKKEDKYTLSYKEYFEIRKERKPPFLYFDFVNNVIDTRLTTKSPNTGLDTIITNFYELRNSIIPFDSTKGFLSHENNSAILKINNKYYLFDMYTLSDEGYAKLTGLWSSLFKHKYIESIYNLKSEHKGFY